MDSTKFHIPFGLLFEEPALQPAESILPFYDEETDLSYISDRNGNWIPYVETMSTISTNTVTEAATEPTDSDELLQSHLLATQRETRIQNEITETDRGDDCARISFCMDTNTTTAVEKESTDSHEECHIDLMNYRRAIVAMSTNTIVTKAQTDTTDVD